MSYVSVVTDFFATRQGSDLTFSPEDYATVAEWEKQGIPLAFALKAIDRVISGSETRSEAVGSIIQMNSLVNSQFVDWLKLNSRVHSC